MKNILKSLMSVAAAALAFTSCSNDATEEVMPNGGSKTLVVNATIDRTRTTLDDEFHVNLEWATDDKVHLYIGATATQGQVIDHTIGSEITDVDYKNNDPVYAYYSIKTGQGSDGVTKAQLNIPSYQKQTRPNVFEGKNMPMVANGTITDGQVGLAFQPVGCVLVFNVYGPAENENIKSIKFETTVPCGGYGQFNLTDDPVVYTPYERTKAVSVELPEGAYAPIAAAKPNDTQVGNENQVYLVVAQANYPVGSKFIVTTDAGEYTFTTAQEFDCEEMTARVVNLNLANAAGFNPAITVSTIVPEQAATGGTLEISGITFKNISAEQVKNARVAVYSDEELTTPLNPSWISFPNSAAIVGGVLNCEIAANTETASRTAYIGIECADVKSSAIAVTQVGAGSTPAENVVVTYVPSEMKYTHNDKISSVTLGNGAVTLDFARGTHANTSPQYNENDPAVRCYEGNTITVSGSKILKIEFARTNTSGKLSADSGEWENELTWKGESNKVVLSVVKNEGQFRIKSMKITYVKGSGSGEQPDPTPDPDPEPDPDPVQPVGNTASLTLKDISAFTWNGSKYIDFSITAEDGSVWTGHCMGNNDRLQIGNTLATSGAKNSYVLVPNADKGINKITFTPGSDTGDGRVLVLLPENFDCSGKSKDEVKAAAYAISAETAKESTTPISIDLTDKDPKLKRFIIRALEGVVYLTEITIEYEE